MGGRGQKSATLVDFGNSEENYFYNISPLSNEENAVIEFWQQVGTRDIRKVSRGELTEKDDMYAYAQWQTIENTIERFPDNTGELFRGKNMTQEELDKIKVGDIIDQNGISSWTKDSSIAAEFAFYGGSKKPVSVVFRAKNGLSKNFDMTYYENDSFKGEQEVIVSSKSKQRIVSIHSQEVKLSEEVTSIFPKYDGVFGTIYIVDVEDE